MYPGDSEAAMQYQYAGDMAHPECWSRDDVSRWLKRCVDEYDLSSDVPDRFLMNGSSI